MFSKLTQIDSELKTKPKAFDLQNLLVMHFRELLDIQGFFGIFFSPFSHLNAFEIQARLSVNSY
jgi:hypothetical protein